jgi:signal transduction histidine kinase/CheY-like chemotaxis protein
MPAAPPDAVLYHSWPRADGSVRLEYLSDGAEELLEASADEVAALFTAGRLPLDGVDAAEFYRAAGESLANHAAWRAEFGWVGPKTGRRRWLRACDFPRRTPDGVPYFVGVVTDQTEQAAVELELTLSEERLRTALRAANLLVWDVDRRTGRVSYSDPMGEFYGVPEVGPDPTPDEAALVLHPDAREQARAEMRAALGRDEPYTVEFRGAADAPDGGPRWFAVSGRSVFGPDGQWARHIGVAADVTARRRVEADRQALDRQLAEARRYDSLGVMAGGLAHDFNNLLTVILGNAEVAKAAAAPGSMAAGCLEEIEAAGRRAAHLCAQMTAYAGVGRMQVGAVDAAALFRQMESALRTDAAPANFALTVAPDLPPLAAEPFQVRQAVRNVVTNAGEATASDGWVRVDVTAGTVAPADSGTFVLPAPPGEYVVVRVADTGAGMTAEVKAKAFDPFFSTRFAGRGLGLAAVLGIVRGHRGGVRLSSAPGRGTVVELFYPVAAAVPRRPDLPGELLPSRPTSAAAGGTVLVCDDEVNVRELIASLLEDDGFRVCRAKDVADGVAAFAREPERFALAVVDLVMPGGSGYDVVRRLRQLRPGLPAVIVSGFADREMPPDLPAGGPTVVLPKPFRLEQLTATVTGVLNQTPAGG